MSQERRVQILLTDIKLFTKGTSVSGNINNNRRKRGIFNIGGKISKFLWGTLDNDDGERYDRMISEIFQDNSKTILAVRNETIIMREIFSEISNTFHTFEKNEHKLIKWSQNLSSIINDIEAKEIITLSLEEVDVCIEQLDAYVNKLITAINIARNGILSPTLINPETLSSVARAGSTCITATFTDDAATCQRIF